MPKQSQPVYIVYTPYKFRQDFLDTQYVQAVLTNLHFIRTIQNWNILLGQTVFQKVLTNLHNILTLQKTWQDFLDTQYVQEVLTNLHCICTIQNWNIFLGQTVFQKVWTILHCKVTIQNWTRFLKHTECPRSPDQFTLHAHHTKLEQTFCTHGMSKQSWPI